jgi:hypothetical protein
LYRQIKYKVCTKKCSSIYPEEEEEEEDDDDDSPSPS